MNKKDLKKAWVYFKCIIPKTKFLNLKRKKFLKDFIIQKKLQKSNKRKFCKNLDKKCGNKY